jgi:urease accessory protein
MPVGSAQQDVFIEAEEGAYIEFLPDPQVLFPESRFSSLIRVQKARGSTTLVADAFLVHDPSSSDACFSTYASEIQVVSESGEALAIDRQKIEGSLFARHWPGITGHFSAQGSLVIVSDRPSDDLQDRLQIIDVEGAVIGASALPSSCGLFTRILAKDGISLRSAMHAIWSTVRTEIKGAAPRPRRK